MVLHDVVEDSDEWNFDRLKEEGFGEHILVLSSQSRKHLRLRIISNLSREQGITR